MTITVCTDAKGRLTALVIPEGACVTVIEADPDEAFAARFGGEGERVFKYDKALDAGLLPHVPRGYREAQGCSIHDLTEKSR